MIEIDMISHLNWRIGFMKFKILIALVGCLLFASCYRMGPDEGEISTVPVTNNPNAMPGPMKTGPLPSVF